MVGTAAESLSFCKDSSRQTRLTAREREAWNINTSDERVVKPRRRREAYLVRYIDDFVMCFNIERMLSVIRMLSANDWESLT